MHSHSDSTYGRICYKQQINNLYTPLVIIRLCHASTKLTCQYKELANLAEFSLLQILHLCTQKSVCATNFGPLGEIGANFSPQLSSRTQFAKIINKRIIAENQCEKHKNRVQEALASEQ